MKHFIKCSRCSQLVELKSEYMVLCPSCGHKLSNSFSEWKRHNPNGVFSEYIAVEGVSGAALEGVGEQRKITRSIKRRRASGRMAVAGGVALGLFIVVAAVFWFARGAGDSSIDQVLKAGWKLNYYEDLKTTIQFPHALQSITDTTIAEPDTVIGARRIVARNWVKPEVCNLTAMRIEYDKESLVDREKATSQILQNIVAQNGMQAFQYIPSDYELAGSKARMMTGSYLTGTLMNEFRAVMIIRGEELWYYMVAYPAATPEGTILADKLFKTIQIQE